MMTKDFEKYFPLSWEVKIIDTATFIQSEFEPGEHTIKFNADNIAHVDALEYMVKCANLMPEAVEIIKMACFSPCRDLCKYAKNGAPSVDVPECDDCPEGAYYERAKAFLAKLEGGEDDA